MSDFNLAVGISLDGRYITNTVPDDTSISEMKYIAKGNPGCYIAEDVVDGVSRGYIHYFDKDNNEVTEVFYSYDGNTTTVNVGSFYINDGFGTITEVDDTAVLYEYISRTGNEKVYVVSEDYSKKESLDKETIVSEIENQASAFGVPAGSVFGFDHEGDIPIGYEEILIADDDMRY